MDLTNIRILLRHGFSFNEKTPRRRNVGQPQINVETLFGTSTFKTLNNIESIFSISKLIGTTLDNVKATLPFVTPTFTRLGNSGI